jgi:hypothetical protein
VNDEEEAFMDWMEDLDPERDLGPDGSEQDLDTSAE